MNFRSRKKNNISHNKHYVTTCIAIDHGGGLHLMGEEKEKRDIEEAVRVISAYLFLNHGNDIEYVENLRWSDLRDELRRYTGSYDDTEEFNIGMQQVIEDLNWEDYG
jgi:hypothetical protein